MDIPSTSECPLAKQQKSVVRTEISEVEQYKKYSTPENTRKTTSFAGKLYELWFENHIDTDERVPPLDCGVPEVLARAIPRFLTEIRTQEGKRYKATTIKNIYASLNRYFNDNGFHVN